MKTLKELINILTKYKVHSIDVIGNSHSALPLDDFYEDISNKKFSSDDEAAKHYFNSNSKDPKYKKLKKVIKKQLINTTFFIDTSLPSFNESQRAYYNCCKDWASINILLGRAARRAAIELAEQMLKQAIKYEFTILIVDITKTLKGHYGGFLRNKAKYDRYKNLFLKNLEIWNAEMEAEELYIELITNEINTKNNYEIADAHIKKLDPYIEKYSSHKLHLHYFLIKIIKFTFKNDYRNIALTCAAAIDFFESKDYLHKESIALFYYQKTICHIHLKEYEDGKKVSDKNIKLTPKGTYQWFKQLELGMLLAFHTTKYDDAYRVFIQILRDKNFKNIFKSNTENWKLYETYLYYLISMEVICFDDGEENQLSKFRVGKFLNIAPKFDSDFRDTNIPILVIQILFMIQKRKYETATDRIKKIGKYSSSNVYKNENYRSQCFIKMLLEISKARFHRAAVIRKTAKYLKKLDNAPLESVSQQSNIEIIPYKNLWTFLLASLDNSFH